MVRESNSWAEDTWNYPPCLSCVCEFYQRIVSTTICMLIITHTIYSQKLFLLFTCSVLPATSETSTIGAEALKRISRLHPVRWPCISTLTLPPEWLHNARVVLIFLHANREQQTKESRVVDGTSCCVILECLVTSIACITWPVSLLTKWPTTICRFASVL